MKKALISIVLLVLAVFAFAQEYIVICRGVDRGSIAIRRENTGRVVIKPSITQGLVVVDNTICPLVPSGLDFAINNTVQSVTINGNTSIIAYIRGNTERVVVEGNTTTVSDFSGVLKKKVVTGNTTTIAHTGGSVDRIVVSGNTATTTYANGDWEQKTVQGNTITITYSNGNWSKKVIDKRGSAVYVNHESGHIPQYGTPPLPTYQVPQTVPSANTAYYERDVGRAVTQPRSNLATLNGALAGIIAMVTERTRVGDKIVLAKISSPLPVLSDYLGTELDKGFTATGKLTVLAWGQTIEQTDAEKRLQTSDMASDKNAASIGKYLGADAVITGDFTQLANFSQLLIRAVDVRTARVLAVYAARLDNNDPVLVEFTAPLGPARGWPMNEEDRGHLNMGKKYYAAGLTDIAIEEFNAALAKSPELGEAYLYRGHAYRTKYGDNNDRAIADYTAALRINPNDSEALLSRAWLYFWGKHNYDRAIADYTIALQINPSNAEALRNRADAYSIKGDHNRSIADYTALLRITPRDNNVLCERALQYAYIGKHNQAIADTVAALRMSPDRTPKAISDIGAHYLFWLKDYDLAIRLFNAMLQVKPNDVEVLYWRGQAHLDKGDYDKAIADYTSVLMGRPEDTSALRNRGNAYFAKRDYSRAIADYETALRIYPSTEIKVLLDNARKARGY